MPHIILNITHISKKPYYFSTNLFEFLVNFNMIIVLPKCMYKFLFNGNKTLCTTLIRDPSRVHCPPASSPLTLCDFPRLSPLFGSSSPSKSPSILSKSSKSSCLTPQTPLSSQHCSHLLPVIPPTAGTMTIVHCLYYHLRWHIAISHSQSRVQSSCRAAFPLFPHTKTQSYSVKTQRLLS